MHGTTLRDAFILRGLHGISDMSKPIVFKHIPKCGGNNFASFLESQFKSNYSKILNVPWTVIPRWENGEELSNDVDFLEHLEPLKRRLILANLMHMKYFDHIGIEKFDFLTFVREPVDRLLSAYYYGRSMKTTPGKGVAPQVKIQQKFQTHYCIPEQHVALRPEMNKLLRENTLEEVIDNQLDHPAVRYTWSNFIARNITGFDALEYDEEALLELAIRQIDRFKFVGIFEQYDESIRYLQYLYRWKVPYEFTRINSTEDNYKSKPDVFKPVKKKELPEACAEKLRDINKVDTKLYEYAKKRFDEATGRFGYRLHRKFSQPSKNA
jgi:hypothetical protein